METHPSAAATGQHPGGVSRLLVAAQLVLLAGLAATAARPGPWELGIILAGGVLGLWALAAMPLRQMRIVPEVHPRGRLVRAGPYRLIRHPMYSAVLLVAFGLLATNPVPVRLAMGFALAVILAVKLVREERMLRPPIRTTPPTRRPPGGSCPGSGSAPLAGRRNQEHFGGERGGADEVGGGVVVGLWVDHHRPTIGSMARPSTVVISCAACRPWRGPRSAGRWRGSAWAGRDSSPSSYTRRIVLRR